MYYAENELRLDFDQSDRLEFIEFLGGLEGRLQPIIYGLPAFQTGAGELIEELTRCNDGPVDDSEQGYSYAFLEYQRGGLPLHPPPGVRELIARWRRMGSHPQQPGCGAGQAPGGALGDQTRVKFMPRKEDQICV